MTVLYRNQLYIEGSYNEVELYNYSQFNVSNAKLHLIFMNFAYM